MSDGEAETDGDHNAVEQRESLHTFDHPGQLITRPNLQLRADPLVWPRYRLLS